MTDSKSPARERPSFGIEAIIFTIEDLDLLKESAEHGRAMMFNARARGKSYQEKRYEFARDWAGGNHWSTKKTREWALGIMRELEQMRAVAASRAKAGASLPGASGKAE